MTSDTVARRGVDAPANELTVDQLAARVGMTVRNVRAYAARGLLPPPRLVGRTGWYGPAHIARLTLVREMLAQGLTLAAVQKAIENEPAAGSVQALALHRAILAPWRPEAPQETDVATLAARAGGIDPALIDGLTEELARLGVLERLDGDRLRVLAPGLLDAGLRGIALGLPPAPLVAAQLRIVELMEQAADIYVELFRSTVWQEFLDAGAPEQGWAGIQEVIVALQPVAMQAVVAGFREVMAAAVANEVDGYMAEYDARHAGGSA